MSHFHEEQIRSSHGRSWVVVSFLLLFWLNVENLEFRTPWRTNSQFASSLHRRRTLVVIVSRHLFVAAFLIECWKSRVTCAIESQQFASSSHERRRQSKQFSFVALLWLDNISTSCFDWVYLESVLPIASVKLTRKLSFQSKNSDETQVMA